MTLEEATNRIVKHPPIKYLVFGVVPNDGNFRLDCAACISEADLQKEKEKFLTVRTFEVREIK